MAPRTLKQLMKHLTEAQAFRASVIIGRTQPGMRHHLIQVLGMSLDRMDQMLASLELELDFPSERQTKALVSLKPASRPKLSFGHASVLVAEARKAVANLTGEARDITKYGLFR